MSEMQMTLTGGWDGRCVWGRGQRMLNVYGSPWTPQYGISAFQYPREQDVWSNRIPALTDILITHGPPSGFNNIKPSAGCPFLRQVFPAIDAQQSASTSSKVR